MVETVTELKQRNADLEQEVKQLQNRAEREHLRAERLQVKLDALLQKFFGISSEKLSASDQLSLGIFDEAEEIAEPEVEQTILVPAHNRRKERTPRNLDPALPREEVILDIPEEDKICGCGHELTVIGQEVTEKLDIEPPKIKVIRYIRPRYACHHCEGSGDEDHPAVRIAPPVPSIIPGGLATDNTLAYVITAKYQDGLPLYRQEKQFERLGGDISRKTLADWVIAAAEALIPVDRALAIYIRSGPILLIDETSVQVMKEPGRANTTKSWMWCSWGGEPEKPAIRYHYSPSRSAETAAEVVGEFSGLLQADGYGAYETLCNSTSDRLRQVGCFAHTRRKFHEVATGSTKSNSARQALSYIAKIYAVEKALAAREKDDAFRTERAALVSPILDEFKAWLEKKSTAVPPASALGKAVSYALERWHLLVRYLENSYLTPDTNRVENAIRPFVVGRKGWLFSGSPRGARASAVLYSLIETAKANGIEPYRYFQTVFRILPKTPDNFDFSTLLPHNIDLND